MTAQEAKNIRVLIEEWENTKQRLGIQSLPTEPGFLPSGWLSSQHGSYPRPQGILVRIINKLRRIGLRILGFRADYELLIGAVVGIDARLRAIESKLAQHG